MSKVCQLVQNGDDDKKKSPLTVNNSVNSIKMGGGTTEKKTIFYSYKTKKKINVCDWNFDEIKINTHTQ